MSHFHKCRAAELVPYQLEEDRWGSHPECPVEVLADGTQVWRVPPDSVVLFDGAPGVILRQRWRGNKEVLAVRIGSQICWVDWRYLRRIGYTPAARASDAVETAHTTR